MVMPTTIWLHALTTSPAPSGPQCTGGAAGLQHGIACATSSSSPPTMIDSVPLGLRPLPLTGASTTLSRPLVRGRRGRQGAHVLRRQCAELTTSRVLGDPRQQAVRAGQQRSSWVRSCSMSMITSLEASSRGTGL